jgi:hypothetical protein
MVIAAGNFSRQDLKSWSLETEKGAHETLIFFAPHLRGELTPGPPRAMTRYNLVHKITKMKLKEAQ